MPLFPTTTNCASGSSGDARAADPITQEQAAKLIGVSGRMLRKWRTRPDWSFGGPPWTVEQVAEIEAWRARNMRGTRSDRTKSHGASTVNGQDDAGVAELVDLTDAELEKRLKQLWADLQATDQYAAPVRCDSLLKIERILYVRQERAIKAGTLISREEVDAGRVQRIHAVRTGLLQLPRAVAPLLVGLDATAIEAELATRMRSLLESYASGTPIEPPKGAKPTKPKRRPSRRSKK